MPRTFPPKARGGWLIHTRQINELRDEVRRGAVIPTRGFTETPDGILPPTQSAQFSPQFAPHLHQVATTSDTPDIRLSMTPGFAFAPLTTGDNISTAGEEAYHPEIAQFPVEPKVGADAMSADPRPKLALTTDSSNFIYLVTYWASRTCQVGADADPQSGTGGKGLPITLDGVDINISGIVVDADDFEFDDNGTGATLTGTTAPSGTAEIATAQTAVLQLDRKYYYVDPDNPPTFSVETTDAYPGETEGTTRLLMGIVTLDGEGAVDFFAWFVEGTIWLHRDHILLPAATGATSSNPAITTAGDVNYPIWVED